MSFAVVLEGMTLIAYVVILAGGKQKRESGWKVLSGLHVCCAALQCAGMAIIVSLPRFQFDPSGIGGCGGPRLGTIMLI